MANVPSPAPAAAKAAVPVIKHIVLYGLGNYSYPLTRHSVGQMAVMSLAKRLNLGTFSTDKKISGEIVEGQLPTPPYVSAADASNGSVAVTLVKSNFLMNISGRTLKPLLARYPLDPTTAHFILHDHLEFPADRIGIRRGGSAGGQNGMRSCLEVLGKKHAADVFQVRIGIDRPPTANMDVADYVLSRAPLDFINRWAPNGAGPTDLWAQVLATAFPPPKEPARKQTREEIEMAMRLAREKRERVRRAKEERAALKAQAEGARAPPADGETP